MIKLWSNKSYT